MAELTLDREYHAKGIQLLCGVDEAGRGPLAGPVFAAAVILPADKEIPGLNDSKKLSEKKREVLYDVIRQEALAPLDASTVRMAVPTVWGVMARNTSPEVGPYTSVPAMSASTGNPSGSLLVQVRLPASWAQSPLPARRSAQT